MGKESDCQQGHAKIIFVYGLLCFSMFCYFMDLFFVLLVLPVVEHAVYICDCAVHTS